MQSGDLIALMMLPEEFGGYRDPRNIVFVPAFVELLKDKIDNGPVRRLVEEGRVVEYTVSPAYAGKCMVPVSLTIMATSPEMMAHYIPIWGSGLDPRR
ncbi:MAG: hypothetical protein Q8M88_11465 [Phenylobacterium sp.]|uniref:hypothetical protein n=1 Tax=Phenylobacterium sp. TaxID=1871053 RepID=UPI0027355B12|nr:hypothetical protein [Phenylobacterium sp.]MDP3175039.1 hypothetical protein [Phenylobacterium sp.]